MKEDSKKDSDAHRVIEIIRAFPPLKERKPEFKRTPEFMDGADKSFDWLVNHWMPSQPDFETLVELTILLGFHVVMVVAALMGEDVFLREASKRLKIESGKNNCLEEPNF